jgi:hypothetical protein
MVGAGMLQCLTSWWRLVLAVSGHGKNKEIAAEIGCICLEQSSYWIARLNHQSAMDPTSLPHNAFKEVQVVRSTYLPFCSRDNEPRYPRRSLDQLIHHSPQNASKSSVAAETSSASYTRCNVLQRASAVRQV